MSNSAALFLQSPPFHSMPSVRREQWRNLNTFRWAIAFARSAGTVISPETAAEPLSEYLRLRTAQMCSLITIQDIALSPTVIWCSLSGRLKRRRHNEALSPWPGLGLGLRTQTRRYASFSPRRGGGTKPL